MKKLHTKNSFTIHQYSAKTALDLYYLGYPDRAREYLSTLWKFRGKR